MVMVILQLDRSRQECEDLGRELRRKDQEMERVQQEKQLEIDRVRGRGTLPFVCLLVCCSLLFVGVYMYVVCLC